MHKELLERFLCCPVDKAFPLEPADAKWSGPSDAASSEMESGSLRCPKCDRRFPVDNGIPNLLTPRDVQDEKVARAKERESKARDEDSTVYDSTVSAYHTQVELEALLSSLDARRNEVVLDLGAGTGRLTIELATRASVVIAADISPKSLELNRHKCRKIPGSRVHHLAVDACYIPLRDAVVHKAGSGMMLEHIPTPDERQRCLDEIRRVLVPGGEVALTVYNYSWKKRRRWPREGFHGKDLYFYNLDRAEMRKMLVEYRIRTLTGLLNLPQRIKLRLLDRAISAVPPVAGLTGELLLAVAARKRVPSP